MEVTWTTPHQGHRELVVLGEAVDEVTVHHAGVGGKEGAAELLVRGDLALCHSGSAGGGAVLLDAGVLLVGKSELGKTPTEIVVVARLDVAVKGLGGARGEERDVEGAAGELGDKSRPDPAAALALKLIELGALALNALGDLGNHLLLVESEGRKGLSVALGSGARSKQNLLGRVGSTRLRTGVNTRRRMDGIGRAKSRSNRHCCVGGMFNYMLKIY